MTVQYKWLFVCVLIIQTLKYGEIGSCVLIYLNPHVLDDICYFYKTQIYTLTFIKIDES